MCFTGPLLLVLLVTIGNVRTAYAGVTIDTITPGDGISFPKDGQTIVVHYTGTLLADGTQFDSSREHGRPYRFVLGAGQVIQGYEVAIPQMSKGQRAKLTFTPDYAYGESGYPGVIPPNASLVFDVELLSFEFE